MTADLIFQTAVKIVLDHEGGYVDDPLDPGGATNFGISARAYPSEDIKEMTAQRARDIYFCDYWLRYRIRQLPGVILPSKVLDMAVLLGGSVAIRLLQCALVACGAHVDPDGVIGPETVKACSALTGADLIGTYETILEQHFQSLVAADPKKAKFLSGWLTRAHS